MSVANSIEFKWQHVAGISLVCGLALAGCSRSDEETVEVAEEPVVVEETTPVISCDNPMVQDRLKSALRNTLNQQAQTLAASYANEAQISLSSATITSKVSGILIDVQNTAVLQETNDNGMTTCQASVSMTLPSEDLYLASQLQAANNQPSLQTRLAQNDIRINNNMLVDNAFTYVVGTQGGQVQTRIAGQPAMVGIVADVIAGSTLTTAMSELQAQRAAQEEARRRRAQAQAAEEERARQAARQARQPAIATPPAPAVKPATAPTINTDNNQVAVEPGTSATLPATPTAPKAVPKDETIDMIIVEDESATY
ncbi:hypothetical protein [Psychrobacter sp. DM8]|uniref:hypothetical protein n=1 Tax=unclassified Psychrobacter TaxID=196806 RepID=UPI003F50345A